MLQLEHTTHASVRVRQRGLRETDIGLIMELGTEVRPGMFMITKKDVDILISEICSIQTPQGASWLGMSVCEAKRRIGSLCGCAVIADGFTVITAFHKVTPSLRTDPRRHPSCQRRRQRREAARRRRSFHHFETR